MISYIKTKKEIMAYDQSELPHIGPSKKEIRKAKRKKLVFDIKTRIEDIKTDNTSGFRFRKKRPNN